VPDVSIVIPAKNEAAGLPGVLKRLFVVLDQATGAGEYEIVVVDDGSDDGTGDLARELGARVVRHPYPMGNGAAVKAGIRAAVGEIVLCMDADGQHAPEDVPRLLAGMDEFAMVVGARTRGTGTGFHRGIANRVYNAMASYVVRRKVEDLTSGFRAFRRKDALRFLYLLPNTFSYPTTITLSFFRAGLPVRYEPIKAGKRVGKSHIRLVRDGIRFFLIIVKISTIFSPLRVFLPAALWVAVIGIVRYVWVSIERGGPSLTNGVQLALLLAIVLFALALISEQVAALRFDRSEKER
jgi:glycosyltransferase involved in cell wall biosynthesis